MIPVEKRERKEGRGRYEHGGCVGGPPRVSDSSRGIFPRNREEEKEERHVAHRIR